MVYKVTQKNILILYIHIGPETRQLSIMYLTIWSKSNHKRNPMLDFYGKALTTKTRHYRYMYTYNGNTSKIG